MLKRGDKELQDMVLSIYNFVMASPYPKEWLNENVVDLFNIDENFDFYSNMVKVYFRYS